MTYTLKKLGKAEKFLSKHDKDKVLNLRIYKKFHEILENPFRSDFRELKSRKCPKCQRAIVGDYRIIFHVSREEKIVEIVDIILRSNDYRNY